MKEKRYCKQCGAELTRKGQSIFCSTACERLFHFYESCKTFEKNGTFPTKGKLNETDRRVVRKYLSYKVGRACSVCGATEWNGEPIPLIVDHIDGNPSNHSIENFRLICPNCDALSNTYKGRNLSNPNYVKGDRSTRKATEYDRMLSKKGLTRSEKRVRAQGICLICHKTFNKRRSSQIYCSRACADIARKGLNNK